MSEVENRALVDRVLSLLLAKDMAGFVELWQPDGVLEFPFAPPGHPNRLVGHADLHKYLRDYPEHVDLRAITELRVHQSTDPAVVIAEFQVDGAAVRTGRPYQLGYVAVLTVRDGRIAHYRDYWSPMAADEALSGTLDSTFGNG